MDRHHRSLVRKLVSGISPLRLKTGQYKGLNEDVRYCQVCEKNEVEYEEHLLFSCEKLKNTRDDFLDKLREYYPEMQDKPNLDILS